MNRQELRLALRMIPFLDEQDGNTDGVLRLRDDRWLVWHPDVISWLWRRDRELGHPKSRTLSPLLGNGSLLWMDGPSHAAYRRIIVPALRGRLHEATIRELVDRTVAELRPGDRVGLAAWTRKLTLRVVGRILLGTDDEVLLTAFTNWLDRRLGNRMRTLAHRFLGGGAPRFDDELDRMLLQRARTAEPPALAALLPEEGLRDQLVSLLFAGHETTASATAWTVYWLDRNPELVEQIQAGEEELLTATIMESLRLCPPATLAGNRVTSDGVVLSPSIYLAHRRPEFDDPKSFNPKRFLKGKPPNNRFFPFGGGVRHCPGMDLALLEIRLIVTALLARRRVVCVPPPRSCEPQLRGAAMAPPPGLSMVTTCRP
ncbi:cytochrome P450 [Lentzea sp. NBRC 105346]|uniref:cytochrome P450 n=1 Tax=Lentzea sp. NBRC 105346 TaxID=3032205 RepID=UPI0024A15A30|nr:cytochrome P450 [Lentzea sp. NBRC 105346]GLZ28716.1 cytochrome P450 [Lentzea sp. NBRC 105346]